MRCNIMRLPRALSAIVNDELQTLTQQDGEFRAGNESEVNAK